MKFEKIGNVFLVIRSGANIKQDKVTDGYPITRIETIADGTVDLNRVGYASIHDESFSEFYLQENDILMSHINSVSHLGKVALVNQIYEKVIHGMNLLCLKADVSIINPMYSFYYFKSPIFRSKIERITKKSVNQASFNISNLKDIEIPLPPLPDQLHIANLLSKAENLIAQRKESIRMLDEFLKSTFLEMFGDPVRNEKGWEKVALGNICKKIGSGSTPRGGKESYHKEGISLIRSLNVHNDEFVYKDLAFIDDKQAHELRNVIIEENDVLLNITGASVARCCIVPIEILPARVNQHVSIIRPDSNILNPRFLSRMFTCENYQLKLVKDAKSKGATREAITKEELELMKVIAPPIELQTQFAQIVEKTETLKTQYQRSLQELENLYGSLSQRAFRGELSIGKHQKAVQI